MVRPLSKELQKKAIEELHEDPARVEEDIKHIQEWIKQQPHLNVPTVTKLHNEADFSYILVLPYPKNYEGPRVVLIRYRNLDTNTMTVENSTQLLYMMLNILMVEDDNLIVSGVLIWLDMVNFPLNLVLQLTPTYLKNLFESFQKALPLRFKGILLTGSFSTAQTIFNLMKVYMGPKLRDRVFIYNKDQFEDVLEKITKNHLPREYGGENNSVENIKDYWIKKVESYSAWFEESNQYGTNEAKRQGKSTLLDDVVGIDGSFRKLDID